MYHVHMHVKYIDSSCAVVTINSQWRENLAYDYHWFVGKHCVVVCWDVCTHVQVAGVLILIKCHKFFYDRLKKKNGKQKDMLWWEYEWAYDLRWSCWSMLELCACACAFRFWKYTEKKHQNCKGEAKDITDANLHKIAMEFLEFPGPLFFLSSRPLGMNTHFDSFVVGCREQWAWVRGEGHASHTTSMRFDHRWLALAASARMAWFA